jgi:DNA-binding transcriptional ArsR family regulator
MPDGERTLRLTKPRQMRALAHPLRLQLLGALRAGGPATATILAERVEASVPLVSYHLRQLAAHGFIEAAESPSGDGRERWWQASHDRTSWSRVEFLDTPERRAAEQAFSLEVVRRYAEAAERWVERSDDWPPEWVDAADMSDWIVHVTPEELRALRSEIAATIERLAAQPKGEGRALVHAIVNLIPRGEPPR